jgi:ABC-type transport system substrate-binding protein
MTRASTRRLAPLLAIGLLMLAACGAQQAEQTTSAPGASEAPQGSTGPATEAGPTLSIAFEPDIQSMDPAIAYDYVSITAVHLVFESLIGYDEGTTLVPVLAEDMPAVSDDGLTYTFTLREGVNFVNPDGSILKEMTADDVAYSLNRILNPNLTPTPSPVAGAFFIQIEGAQDVIDGTADEATGIEVIDDRTIAITITAPNRAFLNVLAMTFGAVVPEGTEDDTSAFSEAPIGTGPFYLESYTSGDEAHFVRNPHYWGDAPPSAAISFQVGVDTATQTQRVQANELDITGDNVPTGLLQEVRGPDYVDRLHESAIVAVNYVAINNAIEDPPLNDVLVRRAIAHAIDKENLVEVVGGRGEVANCIFPPAMDAYDPECNPYPYDPDRARELLAEAGVPDGFSTTYYTDPSEDSRALAQATQQDLAAVGIEVEIVTQEFDVLIETILAEPGVPLLGIAWLQDYPDPSDFYDPILSCAAIAPAGFNTAWACSEEADALAAEALGMQDVEERADAYREVQRLFMDEVLYVPTTFPEATALVSERMDNFSLHPVWLFDLAKYTVSE